MLTTAGHLLNGRVRYSQPAEGFRSGIEPVFLAASVPVRAGQRVLEAGSGAGAGLLCVAARVPEATGTGVEIDSALTALAAQNAADNGFSGVQFIHGAIEQTRPEAPFHHAMANPPYHAAESTASPDAARARSKRAPDGLLAGWIAAMAAALVHRGSLTLIIAAPAVPACLSAMAASGCPAGVVFPLWPKAGRAARLVLLRGTKGGRAPLRVAPGLVLHTASGAFTPQADAILRGGGPLAL